MTLYSIDGNLYEETAKKPVTKESLYEYPILGKVEITDPEERKQIALLLKKSVGDGEGAKCFEPRHAIRSIQNGRTVDYLLCFVCARAEIRYDSKVLYKSLGRDLKQRLNEILRSKSVPLAPGPRGSPPPD
jgi:hypothetical protein